MYGFFTVMFQIQSILLPYGSGKFGDATIPESELKFPPHCPLVSEKQTAVINSREVVIKHMHWPSFVLT